MRCDAYRQAWLSALYAGDSARDEVREHIAGCSGCARWRTEQNALDAVLQREAPIEPGLGFDTRFFARLEDERGRASGRSASWLRSGGRRVVFWFAPVLLAGSLALAVFVRRQPSAEPAPAEDLALMRDLELVEDLPVVQHLAEIEAYETLAQVKADDLDAVLREGRP